MNTEVNSITERIINSAYKVINSLGPGFLEKVYEKALMIELHKNNLNAENQKPIKIFYDNQVIGEYFADILVENVVILELKVVKSIDPIHIAQTVNYLKACKMRYGLILNFVRSTLEIKRVIR